jgi:membrane-bound lytic murein transglycosylase A
MTGISAPALPALEPLAFRDLRGWQDDDHEMALAAFRRSCGEIISEGRAFARPVIYGGNREDWLVVCRRAEVSGAARAFFEREFQPFAVRDPARPEGLFTGYYEPEVQGSPVRSAGFSVPVYGRPGDLVAFSEEEQRATGLKYGRRLGGQPMAYFTRKEIEQGALAGQGLEIAWLSDWADAFFIHVQGSGRIRFADGGGLRLAFAAKSGRPYTSIGRLLVDRCILPEEALSMQALRRWMAANPGAARELMWENQSFIFFRKVEDGKPDLGATGAQGVQLTPMRSLAVDRSHWIFGTPVWLETEAPTGSGAQLEPFRHLLIAQDTGTAIRGFARTDVYWGWGELAEQAAGHMQSPGRMVVLLPQAVASRIGAGP